MKNVQIPYELFAALVEYHLAFEQERAALLFLRPEKRGETCFTDKKAFAESAATE